MRSDSRSRIALMGSGAALAIAMMAPMRAVSESIITETEEVPRVRTVSHPYDEVKDDADMREWATKVGALTEAQAHVFRAFRQAGVGRQEAYDQALQIDPALSLDDLQATAKQNLMERAPRYAAAEAKRQRKAAKLARQAAGNELTDILAKAQPLFGLEAQGHIPTIEKMLADGKTWAEIGEAIHWDGDTAWGYYERYKARG